MGTFYDGSQRQKIERIIEVPPNVRVAVLASDLVEEAIDHCSVTTFVITSQQRYPIRVLHLKQKQKTDGFDAVVATVDEVADHDVLAVTDIATYPKHLQNVVELAVDVTCDQHGSAYWLDVGFLQQEFLDLAAELLNDWLG